VPLCRPQIPHAFTRDQNRAFVVKRPGLTCSTMARSHWDFSTVVIYMPIAVLSLIKYYILKIWSPYGKKKHRVKHTKRKKRNVLPKHSIHIKLFFLKSLTWCKICSSDLESAHHSYNKGIQIPSKHNRFVIIYHFRATCFDSLDSSSGSLMNWLKTI